MARFYLFTLSIVLTYQSFCQITKADYYNVIDNKVYTFSKQNPEISFDSIVGFVKTSFVTQEDRVRAYYTWIALNISYDVDHMNELTLLQTYHINSRANSSQKPATVLKDKKAVCEGYSNLMVQFCEASAIPCFLVCGYTKTPDGEIPDILHAWNVLKIDSAWFALDITWSSGYVNYAGKFVRRFSNHYFLPRPKVFIKDHFPIDPMWQLLRNPFVKQDFEKDSLLHSHTSAFNFPDSIKGYMTKSKEEQRYLNFLHYHWAEPSKHEHSYNLDVLTNNSIVEQMNRGAIYQSDFMDIAKNKLDKKPTLSDCKQARVMLDSALANYKQAQALLSVKKAFTSEYDTIFKSMQESIANNCLNIQTNIGYLTKLRAALLKKKT